MLGRGVAIGAVRMLFWIAVLVAFTLALVAGTPAATEPNVGYDISYPQCNGAFPSGGAFGVVGVNGGLPYSVNPCLGTGDGASELSWAGMNAQLYANTADPGPALSSHWPNGQSTPKQCNTLSNPGSDTAECHYDYGWNAAADSYQDAVNAYISLGWAAGGSTRTPVANQWWLDVETANSWTSTPSLNVQALQGEADYFVSVGAAGVGFYSTGSDWQTITGGTNAFSNTPSWLAGAASLSDAQSRCGGSGFTGGAVALVQFPSGGFDADYHCVGQPALSFGSAPQSLTAGAISAPMSINLSEPTTTTLAVTVTSSSPAGSFATSSAGPWSASLTLSIAGGSSASGSFYYEDMQAGSPILTASATGYASATQSESVGAAPLAAISVTPASATLRVGASQGYTAAGSDAYGNAVAISPSWSVSPILGSFSPNPGNPTTFKAAAIGNGTVTAAVGGISGTAAVSVVSKKRHIGGAITLQARVSSHQSVPRRATLYLRPSVVVPGGTVRLYGVAARCGRSDTLFLLSPVLRGRSFLGLGAITTPVRALGAYAAVAQIRTNATRGYYVVRARCGGRILTTKRLRVR